MEAIIAAAIATVVGYIFGVIRRDVIWMEVCRSQQHRGDYWFGKYMAEVRDDWEAIADE